MLVKNKIKRGAIFSAAYEAVNCKKAHLNSEHLKFIDFINGDIDEVMFMGANYKREGNQIFGWYVSKWIKLPQKKLIKYILGTM